MSDFVSHNPLFWNILNRTTPANMRLLFRGAVAGTGSVRSWAGGGAQDLKFLVSERCRNAYLAYAIPAGSHPVGFLLLSFYDIP